MTDDDNINSDTNIMINNDNPIPLFYQVLTNDLTFQQVHELLNDTNIGVNYLFNVSRIYFQCMKKASFYWKLNRDYSLVYYKSAEYRERISMLIDTKSQVALDLSYCFEVVDVSILSEEYDVNLRGCYKLLMWARLKGCIS
jgi:hypothetical protein